MSHWMKKPSFAVPKAPIGKGADVVAHSQLTKLFSSIVTRSRTLGQKCLLRISPSQTVVANGLLPSTVSLKALYEPSPFRSSVFHRELIFLPCVWETSFSSTRMA